MDILDQIADAESFAEEHSTREYGTEVERLDPSIMSLAKAREITDAIKASATATYVLLAQAHHGKVHVALGYSTWSEYIKQEFNISTARSYQLLNQAETIRVIEAVTPEDTKIKLTEAQARDLKSELPRITERIRTETDGLSPDEASRTVSDIVREEREQLRDESDAKNRRQAEIDQAEMDGYHAGIEAAADALLADDVNGLSGSADGGYEEYEIVGEKTDLTSEEAMYIYNFFNVLSGITSLPSPQELVSFIPESRWPEVNNQLNQTVMWVNQFKTLWETKNTD